LISIMSMNSLLLSFRFKRAAKVILFFNVASVFRKNFAKKIFTFKLKIYNVKLKKDYLEAFL